MHEPHPVRLLVEDDYGRNRLTVFLRLLLAIPHFIWLFLWTILIVITAIVNWVISLFTGRPPAGLHQLMCAYVRYQAHLSAYLSLCRESVPGLHRRGRRVSGRHHAARGAGGAGAVEDPDPDLSRDPCLLVSAALAGLTGGSAGAGGNGRKSRGQTAAAPCSSSARCSAGSPRSPRAGCRRACATRRRTRSATRRR